MITFDDLCPHWQLLGWSGMFTVLADNPHLRQVVSPSGTVELRDARRLQRTLHGPTAPRLPYRRRRGELKTLSHWGQKKLLLSEIEFLTLHVDVAILAPPQGYTCLYAGASPGNHIPYLCYLFPQVHFVLVDPRPYCNHLSDPMLRPTNVTLRQELLSPAVIAEFTTHGSSNNVLLFISDIRSADWQDLASHAAMDEEVMRDMVLQKEWHIALNPTASLLKFRLPWSEGCTRYLRGTVFFPVYGPVGTSETRLLVDNSQKQKQQKQKQQGKMESYEEQEQDEDDVYDHQTYWEQLFYFNTITRQVLESFFLLLKLLTICNLSTSLTTNPGATSQLTNAFFYL